MSEQKQKTIKIINEEINKFRKDAAKYVLDAKYKDAKIAFKALKTLETMIKRIQDET